MYLKELWYRVNKSLSPQLTQLEVLDLIRSLLALALMQPMQFISSELSASQAELEDPCRRALSEMSLTYLMKGTGMVEGFMAGLSASLPDSLDFVTFSDLMAKTCLSPS